MHTCKGQTAVFVKCTVISMTFSSKPQCVSKPNKALCIVWTYAVVGKKKRKHSVLQKKIQTQSKTITPFILLNEGLKGYIKHFILTKD